MDPTAFATGVRRQDAFLFFNIFAIPDFIGQGDFDLLRGLGNIYVGYHREGLGSMANEASHHQSCVVAGAPNFFAAVP
jgi:hypothetical protein